VKFDSCLTAGGNS